MASGVAKHHLSASSAPSIPCGLLCEPQANLQLARRPAWPVFAERPSPRSTRLRPKPAPSAAKSSIRYCSLPTPVCSAPFSSWWRRRSWRADALGSRLCVSTPWPQSFRTRKSECAGCRLCSNADAEVMQSTVKHCTSMFDS
eukprot:3991508-Prymnesium_polylepis.2